MDFDQVYRAFFRDVLFYVWGLCGDRVLAEEIAQETFFKALKSIDRFDGQGDIRPWLFAISKNTYYDHCRKQKKTEPLEAEKEQAAEPLFLEKTPEQEGYLLEFPLESIDDLDEFVNRVFQKTYGKMTFYFSSLDMMFHYFRDDVYLLVTLKKVTEENKDALALLKKIVEAKGLFLV